MSEALDEKLERELDGESEQFLAELAEKERIRKNRVDGVRTILVTLSSRGMVYDVEALRQKIQRTYPEAAVFFQTTSGAAVGMPAPHAVDLLIDFTGPGQRQGLFYAKKLRRMARVAAGRNAGTFRKKIYDRVFDEKEKAAQLPAELLSREREVQKQVLALVGVPLAPTGDTPPDRGKTIPLQLPPLQRT